MNLTKVRKGLKRLSINKMSNSSSISDLMNHGNSYEMEDLNKTNET